VGRIVFIVLALVFASILVNAQQMNTVSGDPQPDPKSPLTTNTLTCTQPQRLLVPGSVAKRAKLKAQLMDLLRESLYDDAKGIVNTPREKEIRKIADELKSDKRD
jgi:hypothetical protein